MTESNPAFFKPLLAEKVLITIAVPHVDFLLSRTVESVFDPLQIAVYQALATGGVTQIKRLPTARSNPCKGTSAVGA